MKNNKSRVYGTFLVNGHEFALDVNDVHEIIKTPSSFLEVPLSSEIIVGMHNLRGQIIPVINFKKYLQLEDNTYPEDSRLAVFSLKGHLVGCIFDSSKDILKVKDEDVTLYDSSNESSKMRGIINIEETDRIMQIINVEQMSNIENLSSLFLKQSQQSKSNSNTDLENDKKTGILFEVGSKFLSMNIADVQEVVRVENFQKSYLENDYCIGLMKLRGQVIALIDFQHLLQMNKTEINDNSRVIILRNESYFAGIIVDDIHSIFTYSINNLQKDSSMSGEFNISVFDHPTLKQVFSIEPLEILGHPIVHQIAKGHNLIYKEDVEKIAQHKKHKKESFITFSLDRQLAVSIKEIREIINFPENISEAPGVSEHIKGVINLRGEIVTILDTRKYYNLAPSEFTPNHKILIFESNNGVYGLIVDSVDGIINVFQEDKIPLPSLLTTKIHQQFQGDLKEIVTYPKSDADESLVVMVLDVLNILKKVKPLMAA